ncbi:MAG TPA: SDR family NAD(P)-dependent oxidoreductase [Bryobacteraceae bacterium]|nr:SDR family NAD(P)-dependent oxidoreductase [Bryobacteraceae bacterium]
MTTITPVNQGSVLITGGSDGIGRGLAARYSAAGARVMVTGRTGEKLQRAARELPGLEIFANDISKPEEREKLAAHIRAVMPNLDLLINNAGIQRRIPLAADVALWSERQVEIDALFAGPVHLNSLLIPMMLGHGRPSLVVNVTSGGAYLPQPFAPVYSACKAALHSYTMNLRYALAGTSCRVVELIPPAVRTGLAGPNATHGVLLDEFCDSVFAAIHAGDEEIGYGMTATDDFNEPKRLYRALFEKLSPRFPVKTYL